MNAELPPPYKRRIIANASNTPAVRSGHELGGYEKCPNLYTAAQIDAYVEARERILQARIAELSRALVDCMDWMESGRASTDWGFLDWKDGDVYMRAKAALDAAREGK